MSCRPKQALLNKHCKTCRGQTKHLAGFLSSQTELSEATSGWPRPSTGARDFALLSSNWSSSLALFSGLSSSLSLRPTERTRHLPLGSFNGNLLQSNNFLFHDQARASNTSLVANRAVVGLLESEMMIWLAREPFWRCSSLLPIPRHSSFP